MIAFIERFRAGLAEVRSVRVPTQSLLGLTESSGDTAYTDLFAVEVERKYLSRMKERSGAPDTVSTFVYAFFNSPAFIPENNVLRLALLGAPSGSQALTADISSGLQVGAECGPFKVMGRNGPTELIFTAGPFRTYFGVVQPQPSASMSSEAVISSPDGGEADTVTLLFGSGVEGRSASQNKAVHESWVTGMHKFYSRVLLAGAKASLETQH